MNTIQRIVAANKDDFDAAIVYGKPIADLTLEEAQALLLHFAKRLAVMGQREGYSGYAAPMDAGDSI